MAPICESEYKVRAYQLTSLFCTTLVLLGRLSLLFLGLSMMVKRVSGCHVMIPYLRYSGTEKISLW